MTGPLVLGLVVAGSTGWLLVRAAWPGSGGRWLRLCLAAGLGLGVGSGGFYAAMKVAGPSRASALAADLVLLLVAAGLALAARRGAGASVGEAATAAAWPRGHGLLAGAASLLGVGAALLFALQALASPHGAWDAWAIWNLRARFLVRGGAEWRDGLSPLLGWSHPDYPLLLPAAVARLWIYAGRESLLAPILVAAVFTAATVGLAAFTVARLKGPHQALVAGIILLGTPFLPLHGAAQYADVPLAFFVLAPLALLALLGREPTPTGLASLAGLALGLAAWTKNEGHLVLLAVLAGRALAVLRFRGFGAWRAETAAVLTGLAPVLLLLADFRLRLAPASGPLAGQSLALIAGGLLDRARWATVAAAFGREVLGWGGWIGSGAAWLVLYAAALGIEVDPRDRPAVAGSAVALALVAAGYVLVYVITPAPLDWHLRTSLPRLLLHLWPSAVFLYCLVVRPPGSGSGERRGHLSSER